MPRCAACSSRRAGLRSRTSPPGRGGGPFTRPRGGQKKSISFLFPPEVTREKLERAGFRVVAWHDPTRESLEQALARARALETGSLPPLGLHILIAPNFPTVSKNMVRNLEEARIQLINAVLERAG